MRQEILKELKKDIELLKVNNDLDSINLLQKIQLALEENSVTNEEKDILKILKLSILEFLFKQNNKDFFVEEELNYNEGYFVDSMEKLTPPFKTHEHYYRQGEETLLIEWYYIDSNNKKYRRVVFPNKFNDISFLLEDTLIFERKNNLEKLQNDYSKFEI